MDKIKEPSSVAELLKRNEAIEHIRHFGKNDPNLKIYDWYLENREFEKADRFLAYRRTWEETRALGKKAAYPLFVTFGLSNFCNLACAHCYRTYSEDKTKKRSLSFTKLEKVMKECKDSGVYSIGLGSGSELFTYKHTQKIFNLVSGLKFEDVWVFTNGLLLNEEYIDIILKSKITRLSISVDAITIDTYRAVRGEGFYKLMSNIFNFLDKREKSGSKLPVLRVTFVDYNLTRDDRQLFLDFWRKIADEVDLQTLIDVKNVDILRYDTIDRVNCKYPDSMLYVDWNGDYKPCCSEFCKYLTIGNIKNMNLIEAWESDYLNDLRKQLKGEKKLNKACLNCLNSIDSSEVYKPRG